VNLPPLSSKFIFLEWFIPPESIQEPGKGRKAQGSLTPRQISVGQGLKVTGKFVADVGKDAVIDGILHGLACAVGQELVGGLQKPLTDLLLEHLKEETGKLLDPKTWFQKAIEKVGESTPVGKLLSSAISASEKLETLLKCAFDAFEANLKKNALRIKQAMDKNQLDASEAYAGNLALREALLNFRAGLPARSSPFTWEGFIGAAWDPNDKGGAPQGVRVGDLFYIPIGQKIRYIVHFENLASATAPAEDVTITDVLDEDLDFASFQLVQSSHPNVLTVGKDEATRTLRFLFRGINLPPNVNPPEGEGFVIFEVALKPNLPTGATIRNKASIVFDSLKPIETNEVVHTLDADLPQTKLQLATTRAPVTIRGKVPLTVTGSDRGSGLKWIHLYAAMDEEVPQIFETIEPTQTGVTFKGKHGHRYRLFSRGEDNAGNFEERPEIPHVEVQIGEPQQMAGLRLMAIPLFPDEADPKVAINFSGMKWARWDPTANNGQGAYVHYGSDPQGVTMFTQREQVPGKGYWAKFDEATTIFTSGDLPDDTRPFEIPVKKGWNIIGNPWLLDLNWDANAIQVMVNGQTKALKDASSVVEPYAWRWDGSAYQLVIDPSLLTGVDNKLPKWEGAWVFAWQDATLLIPLPQGNRLGQMAKKASEGWMAKLMAQMGTERGQGLFGMNATTPLRIASPPSPPEGAREGVQVFFVDDKGQLVMADFRRKGAAKQEWTVLVKFGARDRGRGMGQEEVTLTFDGIGYAPKDLSLWLVDTVTGKRLYLRTQQAYQFVPQSGEQERRLKVIAEIGNERPLRVLGLKATPLRGRGMSIQFTLTKAAQTQVELLTLTGRRIAIIESGQNRGAGLHQIFWQGRGTGEVSLPSGMPCLVRLLATDEEGRQVQATTVVR
jgi:uncharacterized repeat protein (TIGR01451 family)